MDGTSWFKIVSWHAYSMTSRGGLPKARCGKWGERTAELVDDLPLGEKSCETCLRLTAHDKE